MAYDQKSKYIKNSPLPCWVGYERVPGTAQGAKGSCRKSSPGKKVKKTQAGANLKRWFKEEWRNQRGEVGYKKGAKGDVYRPTKRVNSKTPTTFKELSSKEVKAAQREKASKGRVKEFKKS